ncbi:hypothetical protein PSHT_01161 [Puccinia striiformis]|uniref:Uncharacterized protein n=1 Tax=Puccinia striiformis TaxID=27350 RepID=A0A2S4WL97_9BASI|nr:hypothetical protein PSHT_01161 [Puccinia striiformis]
MHCLRLQVFQFKKIKKDDGKQEEAMVKGC